MAGLLSRFSLIVSVSTGLAVLGCDNDSDEGQSEEPPGATGGSDSHTDPHGHGGEGGDHGHTDDDPGPTVGQCAEPAGACELVACAHPKEDGLHVEPCASLTPTTNPPTSGTHYDIWANFIVYDEPVPWGFLIHSIEHSGVVLAYNCDEAESEGTSCDELRDSLVTFYEEWPDDPLCEASPHRLIVVPDPNLDVPFAAAAWGHSLKGNCLDEEVLSEFINEHYGKNYENICNPGVDPLSAYSADCGE